MDVLFRGRRLQRCFEDSRTAAREWGPVVGARYIERIHQMVTAGRLADLFALRALDFHPLAGDRAGQYAMRLSGRMRLIVTIPEDGMLMVEEVVDYHG